MRKKTIDGITIEEFDNSIPKFMKEKGYMAIPIYGKNSKCFWVYSRLWRNVPIPFKYMGVLDTEDCSEWKISYARKKNMSKLVELAKETEGRFQHKVKITMDAV